MDHQSKQIIPAIITSTPAIITTQLSHSSTSSSNLGSGGGSGSGGSGSSGGSTGTMSTVTGIATQGTIERLSRPMAFDKMEALVREMQDPESGVPVRSQKLFLTSIPSVFMGYDLVDWLMERLGIEECEALNIAFQLCLHGYLFPVSDWRNLFVKDDSTFYRFQSPYYWPWQQKPPDNVEYAIYLAKRSLRNKQKHGLEDYELEILNNLHKNLKGKWEFITMQAEEQIKLAKERKKGDKVVSDSQERAYWRVHRPPPGQFTPLESCPVPLRNKPRKRTAEDLQREINMLKNLIARTRMKMSQACDCLVQYHETYVDYDPLMSPAQPSNPWVTDDITFWQFSAARVEVLSEKRVKKWAISIEDLVNDPTGLEEFTNYLKKEYSHENIRFWSAVNDLRRSSQSQISRKVKEIYEEFLKPGAPCEINIDGKTMEQVQQGLKNPSRFAFDVAADHVYALLLKKDCYPRFIRSEHYKHLLANAVQPSSKKRFFGFGGATKKKGSTTQPPNSSLLPQGSGQSTGVISSLTRRRGSDRSLTGSAHELAISGVKDASKVPHSHSQSNLSEITYNEPKPHFSTNLEVSIELPATSCAVCPWDTADPEPTPSAQIAALGTVAALVTDTDVKSKKLPETKGALPQEMLLADVSDMSDKMKRSCRLRQQNTLDSDFLSSKRLLPTVNENRRASMTNAEISANTITLRTSSFSESTKPMLEAVAQTAQKSFLEAAISTPLLLVESRSIQSSTIIEETSRANSEANLPEKVDASDPQPTSQQPTVERSSVGSASDLLTASDATGGMIDTDKSSSQSSLPIINVVSEAEDDENSKHLQSATSDTRETTSVRDEIVQTDESVLAQAYDQSEDTDTANIRQIEALIEHHEPPKEQQEHYAESLPPQESLEEELAEASIPEEQTLSEQNMPGVIRKLSIKSEEQRAAESHPESEYEMPEGFNSGFVAPAPTPAPSMAPLAEIDQDPEDESDEGEASKPAEAHGSEHSHHKKRRKKKDAGAVKKQETPTAKGNLVCPWEDEDDNTSETPFVKTYATLGYL